MVGTQVHTAERVFNYPSQRLLGGHSFTMIKSMITTEHKMLKEWVQFRRNLKGVQHSYVTIGLHEGAGNYPSGVSVVQVGLWNEFGVEPHTVNPPKGQGYMHPGQPERSFIRSTIRENSDKINRWRVEMIRNMMKKNWTVEKCLRAMGTRIQILIQNKIKSGVEPVNAPSTLAAKAAKGVGSKTLMDSKLMLRSVTFKVVLK